MELSSAWCSFSSNRSGSCLYLQEQLYKSFCCSTAAHHWTLAFPPTELLNGWQIRSKLDMLFPSPARAAQGKRSKDATKSQLRESSHQLSRLTYMAGACCYALYRDPKRDRQPRWVPAVMTKVFGSRTVSVRDVPWGLIRRQHIDQLCPWYRTNEDADPGEMPSSLAMPNEIPTNVDTPMNDALPQPPPATDAWPQKQHNGWLPHNDQFGVHNLRWLERLWGTYIPTGQDASG